MASSAEITDYKEEGHKIPWYQDVDGIRIPGQMSANAFREALAYKARPDDIFIVTYPRCGTTWVQNIVASIFRSGKPFSSFMEFLCQSPYIDMLGGKAAENMKRPGAIKLHRPFYLTPWSPEAKYIFVTRNPKDCCVSLYNLTKNIPGYLFENGKFDDFFELFIKGETDYGDYFDTLLSWYEHRCDPNVLFLVYEKMKNDTKYYVLKIAEFLGSPYKEALEKNEKILQDVIYHSSFDFMREFINENFDEMISLPKEFVENNPDIPAEIIPVIECNRGKSPNVNFVRKGIVGDWRNYFSPEQSARMDKKFKERTSGTDIADLWENKMQY